MILSVATSKDDTVFGTTEVPIFSMNVLLAKTNLSKLVQPENTSSSKVILLDGRVKVFKLKQSAKASLSKYSTPPLNVTELNEVLFLKAYWPTKIKSFSTVTFFKEVQSSKQPSGILSV